MKLDDLPDLLTVSETADILRVTEKTVYRYCEDGTITAVKVGGSWRIQKTVLVRLLGPTFPHS